MHSAKLVWITPNAEQLIAKMARVSNPANEDNPDSQRLIRYLIKHKHWSPFEMVSMCVEINTTRSIAQQILRHRSFSFQEFSTRYAEVVGTPVVPELRRQDTKNRQNSIDDLDKELEYDLMLEVEDYYAHGMSLYGELLRSGVAKECARELLPLATPTRMYMSGTLRSWLHYCDLRCGNGTQLEHRRVADSVLEILYQEVPNVCQAMWGDE